MAFGSFSGNRGSAPMAEINIIPLVDIMLVLLVIFIITAPLLTNSVKIDLPHASSSPNVTKAESIQLAINGDGQLFWNGEPIAAADLAGRFAVEAQKQPAPELHLHADRNARYEVIAEVMSDASKAGLVKIGFVTDPSGRAPVSVDPSATHAPEAGATDLPPQRRAAGEVARRAFWLKTLHQWHWISSAICLIALILFAATGITLNHAAQIKAKPQVTKRHAILPAPVREEIIQQAQGGHGGALPTALRDWLDAEWSLRPGAREAEWSEDEVYLSLPRPGGDAWLSVTLPEGEIEYEGTDRGWIAYFNDLHKARNTGLVWSAFVDIFAVACLVFSITGLFLLKLHAAQRGMTWPLVALGFVLPLLLALLFIH